MTWPVPDEILERPHRNLGRTVWRYSELQSTNTLALELGDQLDFSPSRHGLAIIADRQTRGRGQHERVWEAPGGVGVLMSVLLDPPTACRRPAILTSWMAVSVARVVEEIIGGPVAIKWPNDVLWRGKKLAGLLIEMQGDALGPSAVVIGVGINVRLSDDARARIDQPGTDRKSTRLNSSHRT